ncbi:MAG: ribonuclease H-like YkuK family protein [bacterium]
MENGNGKKKTNGHYYSPTYGEIELDELKKIITSYMSQDKKARYQIIVGSDSQKQKSNAYDFVSALIIHHVGSGGIYFWRRDFINRVVPLKERIYHEALMSMQTSENFINFFKINGIAKYDIQIHIDIGKNGDTRDMINEITGMVRSNGYDVKIKPDSYGASKIADRHI